MQLEDIHKEVVALKDAVNAHMIASAKVETDLAWVKRAVLGAFSVVFSVLGYFITTFRHHP